MDLWGAFECTRLVQTVLHLKTCLLGHQENSIDDNFVSEAGCASSPVMRILLNCDLPPGTLQSTQGTSALQFSTLSSNLDLTFGKELIWCIISFFVLRIIRFERQCHIKIGLYFG